MKKEQNIPVQKVFRSDSKATPAHVYCTGPSYFPWPPRLPSPGALTRCIIHVGYRSIVLENSGHSWSFRTRLVGRLAYMGQDYPFTFRLHPCLYLLFPFLQFVRGEGLACSLVNSLNRGVGYVWMVLSWV